MDLIFWRHAEAIEPIDGQSDSDRPLSARGERQAARMARWMERQLPESAKIICCPTVRAEQTLLPLVVNTNAEMNFHPTRYPTKY